ncbi:hypothetical protein ASPWEDRAFT_184556 [Aspergillus wentii DTO 134E9]|uniref:Gfo/Idh/MocA-like oxidoreductase N-terminal domain-containing protein n=1 Tax=Aspergillus wentii DTO 134E9 TaxID=1073089 RepID=A0A1L9RGI4_ASPWE|nr:uncharacterized protein ASPWEDRAFT_184556 [Aspergillus wentii DTO 134E9]KAI9927799.1 hypothetical protein MW887_002651 [Aspergillus wentii]OJJ34014.1 hypothetical protein ASPWEDRAFT_184556 [Aspergillus wentii DTO 134E9]
MDRITVVLVGGGTIAPLHAQYLLSSASCTLSAIVDPYLPGRQLASQLSIPHFDSIADLLSSHTLKPDAFIVCVPSSLHVAVSSEIITAATPKAIIVEKPLSTDSVSGADLLSLAERYSCKILVGHHRRFHPSLASAKSVLETGRIGTITAVSGLWTTKKNDGYFTAAGSEWRCSRSSGGGPIWTNFVHDVDVLHFLTGSRIVRVWATATVDRRTHENIKQSDQVEEGAAIMLQFANSIVGTFIVSDNVGSPYGWESATGDNPLYPPADIPVDSYRVFGTLGTMSIPDGTLWTYDSVEAERRGLEVGWNIPMKREKVEVDEGIPFQQQTEHLGRVVRGLEEPLCSGEDGLAAIKVCEAIAKALEEENTSAVDI